jgi:uncharacterized protein
MLGKSVLADEQEFGTAAPEAAPRLGANRLLAGGIRSVVPARTYEDLRAGARLGDRVNSPLRPETETTEAVVLGHVVSVSGALITAALRNVAAEEQAEIDKGIRMGAMVKIALPATTVFGTVNALTTEYGDLGGEVVARRLVTIGLIGESTEVGPARRMQFRRGVSMYPVLGDAVCTVRASDRKQVYAPPGSASVRIGSVWDDQTLPALVATDDLLAKHFAILGSTGSGKSCTTTLLLRAILGAHPNAHAVLLDPHGEYAQAFRDMAEVVNTDNLQLPYWILNFEEICELLVSGTEPGEADAQVSILRSAIVQAKRKHTGAIDQQTQLTVDTPVPYHLADLIKTIEDGSGKLDKPDKATPYLRLKARIESLQNDRRYGFMFSRMMGRDSLPEIMSRILRIPVANRPLSIVDLSGVPSEIVDVVVSLLSRIIFDFAVWAAKPLGVPILLVCEEAHRYIPADGQPGFAATRQALSRIAKEGRKYGVSLCLITQRPSELSPSVLSQCGTVFALRLGNERDQEFVVRALPETSRHLVGLLPGLRPQEAVVIGEGVTVPTRVKFDDLPPEHQPRSESAAFSDSWQHDKEGESFVVQTVRRWRAQER